MFSKEEVALESSFFMVKNSVLWYAEKKRMIYIFYG